tara:strand:- start:2248 stop:2433 length:186 start_codon:yes stop_codon:yes gene_type:complete
MKNVKNIKIAKDLIDFYIGQGIVDNIALGNFLKRHKKIVGLKPKEIQLLVNKAIDDYLCGY